MLTNTHDTRYARRVVRGAAFADDDDDDSDDADADPSAPLLAADVQGDGGQGDGVARSSDSIPLPHLSVNGVHQRGLASVRTSQYEDEDV
jgi:hypothetical protein